MNKTAFYLKFEEALISRIDERRQKTLIGLAKYIKKCIP